MKARGEKSKYIDRGGYRCSEEGWGEIHAVMIENMIRLEKSLRLHIKRYDV